MHALPSPTVVGRMVPSTMARALPLHRAFLNPCLATAARRSLSSSGPRRNVLKGQKTNEKSAMGPGAETLHISELSTFSYDCISVPNTHVLSEDMPPQTAAPVSAVPQPADIHGDWVLFHPVYTPEELRSVEVGEAFVLPY